MTAIEIQAELRAVSMVIGQSSSAGFIKLAPASINESDIIETVLSHYPGIAIDDLFSKYRKRMATSARQLCMFFMFEFNTRDVNLIAPFFNRERTVFYNSHTTVKDLCDTDKKYKQLVQQIRSELKP